MRKIKIDKSNHLRAILTDTLPYEIPLFFTNEHVFNELTRNKSLSGYPEFVSKMILRKGPTRPFIYRVQKGGGSHRQLGIPHPSAQVRFAELYRDFDSFIENICARSPYSLRFPTRVGSHFFQSQYVSLKDRGSGVDEDPASFGGQRKWASSYFYYKRYAHIHRFFSSDEFMRLEQKFSFMLKLDISRCFESIYTHSISWAVRGKEFGKDNKNSFFFESEFDEKMMNSNWGETSGILIGPEVSRIFAESIMQSIDVQVHEAMGDIGRSIEIRRYVDDFFVFGNSLDVLERARLCVEAAASRFNLHLNEKKTEVVPRPFTSHMAVGRDRVAECLNEFFKVARKSLRKGEKDGYFSKSAAERVMAEIRRIARESNVDYSTLASPALAIMARSLSRIRSRLGSELSDGDARNLSRINSAALRISTFLFLMDIKSATSHKIAKIILECSLINHASGIGRAAFEGEVLDITGVALDQARTRDISGPEVINVLVAADAVCSVSKGVTEVHLRSAFGVSHGWKAAAKSMNYFELVSVLYFGRNGRSFSQATEAVCSAIRDRVIAVGSKLASHTEETMLFFDFISCEFIKREVRTKFYEDVAKVHGSKATQDTLSQQFSKISKTIRFVAWEGSDHFQAMLQRRELHPAYDS